MKAKHVTEDPIFKWEFNQETRLKYEDWWQWQLRDAAASGLRDYYVRDRQELEGLAINILQRLGYNVNSEDIDLDKAVDILERFVQYDEVNESSEPLKEPHNVPKDLGMIFKPKSKEEVENKLNQFEIEAKIKSIRDHFGGEEELIFALSEAGADNSLLIDAFVDNASVEELRRTARELLNENPEPAEDLLYFFPNVDTEKVMKNFFENENAEELNDVLNLLIINHSEIYGRLKNPYRGSHFGF